jgi:hypothetical protein
MIVKSNFNSIMNSSWRGNRNYKMSMGVFFFFFFSFLIENGERGYKGGFFLLLIHKEERMEEPKGILPNTR